MWAEEHSKDLFTYEMLVQREMEQDAMLWETPTLALTAQAFLLTIALDRESAPAAVYISACLGVLVAFLSMQLMAKHKFLNELDKAEMNRLEGVLGLLHMSTRRYKAPLTPVVLAASGLKTRKKQGFLLRGSSYRFWMRGLALFAAVNVAIIAAEVFWPFVLHPPTP